MADITSYTCIMQQPAIFIGHGAPTELLETGAFQDSLKKFGEQNRKPAAVVVVSAHWLTRETIEINSSTQPETIYDYGGFPQAMYEVDYPAPGNADLAQKIKTLLSSFKTELNPAHGLDHGAWIPLKMIYPAADIPVVQVSIPFALSPQKIFELGKALAVLRDENILLMGSGNITHNIQTANFGNKYAAPQTWAQEFKTWVKTQISSNSIDNLYNFKTLAPHARLSHPYPDHFYPLFFVLGAKNPVDQQFDIYDQFHYGTLSMWSFGFNHL